MRLLFVVGILALAISHQELGIFDFFSLRLSVSAVKFFSPQ
jgi:hypothetical protein